MNFIKNDLVRLRDSVESDDQSRDGECETDCP